jgi:hypothetical protein
MYIKKKIKISAIAALILFYFCPDIKAGLPLTETIYTIPESEMALSFREEVLQLDNNFRRENFSIGFGILPDLSVWYSLDYLHNDIISASSSRSGDSFLKIWLYLGDYFNNLRTGLLFSFRIPTGPDVYSENQWRNVSFGNNEVKVGPVFRIDLKKSFFLHLNIFYVFRQAENEGFYGAFLSSGRFKNDYVICSMALNTDILYPEISFIPYLEFYTSHRVYKKQTGEYENIPIEGSGINPVLFCLGGRYFFSDKIFLGAYFIFNPAREKNFIKDIFGFDFSLQF